MKRKSVFIKKNVIKAQNTLDKFGIFKKVNVVKKEQPEKQRQNETDDEGVEAKRGGDTVKVKKEIHNDRENEKRNDNIIKSEHSADGHPSFRVKVKLEGHSAPNRNREGGTKDPLGKYSGGRSERGGRSSGGEGDVEDSRVDDEDNDEIGENGENGANGANGENDDRGNRGKRGNSGNNGGDDSDMRYSRDKREKKKKKEDHTGESNTPLHKLYQPIYKEDYINEIRSKRNPLLTTVLDEDLNFNLILCGPPGSGKSSLVNVIKNKTNNLFISLFHLNNLNNELRKIYDQSVINYKLSKKKTILCIKDINRLNKNQQENLLLILKKGYFYLLATCLFNPMNILNASLSSRCLYLYLNPYDKIELALIIKRIINKLDIDIEDNALNIIMNHSCGDARVAINIIEFAIKNMERERERDKGRDHRNDPEKDSRNDPEKDHRNDPESNSRNDMEKEKRNSMEHAEEAKKSCDIITKQFKLKDFSELHKWASSTHIEKKVIQLTNIKNFLQNFPSNDNKLDHFNFISGLHKSIRAGNIKAAILYLTKSLKNGEDPLYICRRLIRIASEDIGLANHDVLSICINTHYACKAIGMPECQTALIYAVIVLCKSSKSNYIYLVENNAKQICNEYSFDVPFHLRNTSNRYVYTNQPEILTFEEHLKKYKDVQKYLPDYIEKLELLPEL
ncbi:unnamed protein product [Plasmodium vivax]|uniref:DNA helicase n=6 Tax=Plasmodium vivax TaxID=5855 RepID=A5K4E2_PLAVS|nr:hypothetical protein, conserved [Plasmodium vivax]KMZ80579.1 hypothetical protein PVIIG_04364 [Plasmodium vivax India VII]KMZ84115.1 hypothetical protein PVBG_02342 [Plasmodium vivax Brazil I]KMZ93171.1 hypothetical protein PVMG_04917 [Plasmodium vivax Mauritania I]KMZ99663.1 hypothetical protein PVNG_03133 [Plasmodium vivax North Korean]EDL45520.1 hypothetical protein, conserved [Plasmodium vivax]|eukprot:XP_001615247.1 hypothetical protein [Plasmodium vivax Sal-1]